METSMTAEGKGFILTTYAATKVSGEKYCMKFSITHKITKKKKSVSKSRYFN